MAANLVDYGRQYVDYGVPPGCAPSPEIFDTKSPDYHLTEDRQGGQGREARRELLNVPYKGFGPAITAAIAGEVPVILGSVVTVYPEVRNGRLTALGVTSAKHLASAPGIPATAETVKGYEADNWSDLVAPAGTPKDIIAKLQATVVETLKSPEVAKRFALEGGEPSPSRTPEEFGAMMRSEVQKWARVVKTARIKAQ